MAVGSENGIHGPSEPNGSGEHDEQRLRLQAEVAQALDMLDGDPADFTTQDMKALLSKMQHFLAPSQKAGLPLSLMPEELTDRILSFCDRATLKAARLVCKDVSRMATPRLFESVHIALIKDVMQNFVQIANHPQLSQCVKRLVFHGQIPRAFHSQRDWERHIDLRPYPADGVPLIPGVFRDDNPFPPGSAAAKTWRATPKHTKTPAELKQHWKAYKAVCDTISDVLRWFHAIDNGRRPDVAANKCNPMRHICEDFSKVMQKLTGLESAVLTCHNFDDDEHPFWKGVQKKILMTPAQWKRYYPPGNSPVCYDQFDYHMEGVVQLSMLLKGLGASARRNKLRSLSVATERDPFWLQEHLWDRADLWDPDFPARLMDVPTYRADFALMQQAFGTLTHLDLDIQYQIDANHDLIAARCAAFLKSATNLEKLSLDFMEGNWEGRGPDQSHCDLLARLQNVEWPRLRQLRLEVITTQRSFLGFLERVKGSLRALSLFHVSLIHGCGVWEDVIRQLPELLKLDTVDMDSLWDDRVKTSALPRVTLGDPAFAGVFDDAVVAEIVGGGGDGGDGGGDGDVEVLVDAGDDGRYLLEDASWDLDENCHTKALFDFITRRSDRMPPLDEDEFYDVHEAECCSCRGDWLSDGGGGSGKGSSADWSDVD